MSVIPSAVALTSEGLQVPHGGKLVSLMAEDGEKEALISSTNQVLDLSHRNACDVELLIVGYPQDLKPNLLIPL